MADEPIYYIEDIVTPQGGDGTYRVILNLANADEGAADIDRYSMVVLSRAQLDRYPERESPWLENNFVYYNLTPNGPVFSSANSTDVAQFAFAQNRMFAEYVLSQNYQDEFSFPRNSNDIKVKSYHVNVGHGNCSIVVVSDPRQPRPSVMMIDCSTYELPFLHGHHTTDYSDNLESTFDLICAEFSIERKEFYVERFFLTHQHYDHYNGDVLSV